jgi:hypothetical protein
MALALHSFAAELPPAGTIKAVEGVYKQRFTNGIITPGKAPGEADTYYEAENILEIVRYDDKHIYIRVELQFYNGHTCSISGMAGHENGSFVYHDPAKAYDGGQACTLTVTPSDDAVSITDRPIPTSRATCKGYCGVRGSLSDVSFPMTARRPIRYTERILKSRQYQKAVSDLNITRSDKSD